MIDLTIKGNPIKAHARAAPVHLNAKVKSKYLSKKFPILPFFPKTINKIYPVTTGGKIRGKLTKLSINLLKGNFFHKNQDVAPADTPPSSLEEPQDWGRQDLDRGPPLSQRDIRSHPSLIMVWAQEPLK